MSKISGPLLDRIDIHIEVPAVPFRELSNTTPGTSSAEIRSQVKSARCRQYERLQGSRTRHNGLMNHRQVRQFCALDRDGQNLLKATMTELGLSARAHDKLLRVARTIADLDESDAISVPHLSEAINYRMLDRQLWT